MFNEAQILSDLNPILREAIVNHNCRELVDSVPFFSKADPEFVATLVRFLNFEMYLYNDEIIREGTIGKKMYFISRGTVRIVNNKAKSHLLSDGAFFGEISLILPNLRRVASVFADSYCYLYSLTVDDFNDVLEEFPLQRKHFIAEAGKRLDNMNKANFDDDDDDRTLVSSRRITKMKPGQMAKTAKQVAAVAKLGVP
jgi:hyperpolarization activated cyclic nucleotide-gated potassium channel 2